MSSRREYLLVVGGAISGAGALLGTGAFSSVSAERTVAVTTAGDASAFLALRPTDRDLTTTDVENAYVTTDSAGTVQLAIGGADGSRGLNRRARTTVRRLITVENNGTRPVRTLSAGIVDGPTAATLDLDSTFSVTVDTRDPPVGAVVPNGGDVLSPDEMPNALGPGEQITIGLSVDLVGGGTDTRSLPAGAYTLRIVAQTTNSRTEETESPSPEDAGPASTPPDADEFEFTQERGTVVETNGFNDVEPADQNVRSVTIHYTGTQQIAHADLGVTVTDSDLDVSYPGYDVYDPTNPGYAVYASDPFDTDVSPNDTRRIVVFGEVYTSAEGSSSGDPSFFHNTGTLSRSLDANNEHRADTLQPGDIIEIVWRPGTADATIVDSYTVQ